MVVYDSYSELRVKITASADAMTSSSFSLQRNFKCNYLTRTYLIKYESYTTYVHASAEDIFSICCASTETLYMR